MADALPKTAFLLNILCDEEFAYRTAYHPSAAVMMQMTSMRRLAERVLLPEDLLFDSLTAPSESTRLEAWCPTTDAVRQWKAKKFSVPKVPSMEVLKLVNHRAFAASIRQPLPGATFVSSVKDALSVIGTQSLSGHWLLKRPFSYAGKGQLRVRDSEALSLRQENWITTSIERFHGLQIEPFVHRIADYSLHGFLFRLYRRV